MTPRTLVRGIIAQRTMEASASLQVGRLITETCTRCDDTQRCLVCTGRGELFTFHGLLTDCRKCDGHGICLECTHTEDGCTGGYRCLCQLQDVSVPAGQVAA